MEGATSGWGSPSTQESRGPSVSSTVGGGGARGGQRPLVAVGWRRITLYVILVTLMLIVFLNIGLTLWILTVLRFSGDGIGPIRIIQGGIELSGRALIPDQLVASSIASRLGQPLTLLSYRNFSVNVLEPNGEVDSRLVIKRSGVEFMSRSFHIRDSLGRSMLSAEGGEVKLGADSLSLSGEGGIRVNTSLQTPLVRAEAGHDLVLESPTRSLEVKAPHSIMLESRAGGITANTLKDIRLVSAVGSVQLDASNVFLHNLTTARPARPPAATLSPARHHHEIYQLCACADGKLFLAPPDGICQTREGDDVCR